MHFNYQLLRALLLSACCTAAPLSWGLPSDRQQPVTIEADQATINDQQGTSVYRGNVTLAQGSMVLKCEALTTHHAPETRALIKAIAEGAPARLRQRPASDKDEIVASAPRMEYVVDKQMVYLLDHAEVTQGRNTFRGRRIEYNISDNLVHAEGGAKERVQVTLFPQEQEKKGKNGVKPQ